MNSEAFSHFFSSIGIFFVIGLILLGVCIGLALHRYSPPKRRALERKLFSLGYGLVWGAAASVLAILALDSTAKFSDKMPPLQFLAILCIGTFLCGISAVVVNSIATAIAWKFHKPTGRPMVDFATVRSSSRKPGEPLQKNSQIPEKSRSF